MNSYRTALVVAALVSASNATPQPLSSPLLENLEWRSIGPALTSGRITDVAVVDENPLVMYVASATGGAWKTVNGGTTWTPVFEREGTASLGAIAVSQTNPNVVWVGTGEDFNARSNSWGDGVYKSEDGGTSWQHMGLTESRHIGRVVIHPDDPDTVLVAAMGSLWGAGEERGLFKTTDGGETWSKVLYISEHTGIADVAFDLDRPELIYAGAHQRERRNWSLIGGGPEGGLFRSTDGGDTWKKVNRGMPEGDLGRIGVSTCRSDPERVYAAIAAQDRGGIFRSDDRGASWERVTSEVTTMWAYGQIRCDPNDADRVYVLLTRSMVSADGGKSWEELVTAGGVHGDHHALWIDPANSDHLVLGTDGGLYFSFDRSRSWEFLPNLLVTQFYNLAVDLQEPFYYVYGGTQDNNTFGGPIGTRNTDGIVNDDWFMTVPGDGFHIQIDPDEPHIVYTESQYGRLVRFDTRTGERRLIQPQPPEGEKYRWNWSSPILISRHDKRTLYFAANKMFKSPDRGDSWEVMSPDLTRQLDHYELPLQGKHWPRESIALHQGTSDYGNITTVTESVLERGRLVAGTDDGQISMTRDDGATWTTVKEFPGVPNQTRVSRVTLSQATPATLYAVFDAHKDNDFRPYVLKSDDFGGAWTNITGNLPEHGSTRVIVEHPKNPDLLIVGTEFSVFVSITSGGEWVELKNNLPTVPVHDMVIHPRENDLVLGTHGRGFWILDDMSILDELTPDVLSSNVHLARARPAIQMHRFDRGRRSQGQRYFRAPNPPDGAIITYYVNPRLMAEADMSTNGDDPEPEPRIEVDVLDSEGHLVRRLEPQQGKDGAGVQRLVWDLRHPLAFELDPDENVRFFRGVPKGPFVLPGDYRVRLKVGTEENEQVVQVGGDPIIEITGAERKLWHDTLQTLNQMWATARAVTSTLEGVKNELDDAREAAGETAGAALETAIDEVEEERSAIEKVMKGEPTRSRAEQRGALPIAELVPQLYANVEAVTAPPTDVQARQTRESQQKLGEQVQRLNQLLDTTLPALRDKLDGAGVRWTPNRVIPSTP